MIKAIIFDFDGVIVESADIKTEAFKELFSDHPDKIKEIVDYHLFNGGISRFVKFRYICENILGKQLTEEEEAELGRRFSQIVVKKVLEAPFVAGAKEFLDEKNKQHQFFIASGTPQSELHDIIQKKGLKGYFKKVQGSPKGKKDIINSILENYSLRKNEAVYVGDAESDRIAAEEAGIAYIERKVNKDQKTEIRSRTIKDLAGLNKILEKIERGK